MHCEELVYSLMILSTENFLSKQNIKILTHAYELCSGIENGRVLNLERYALTVCIYLLILSEL